MDLRQLHYFTIIAEEGSITAAAERLHITQPPLSQQLKKLEEELNVVLFERTSRKLQLTEIGYQFLIRAKQILAISETAKEEIIDYANSYQGTILLGITPTAVPMILSEKFYEFHKKYPSINFELFEGSTAHIETLLRKGIINIGILRSPLNTNGLEYIEKAEESMVSAMLPEYNWSDSNTCCLQDLAHKPLILYHRYENLLMESFRTEKIMPRIVCKSDRSSTTLRAAEIGLGIALLPESALTMARKKLEYKKILCSSLNSRPIAVWLSNRYLSKSDLAFLEFFREL